MCCDHILLFSSAFVPALAQGSLPLPLGESNPWGWPLAKQCHRETLTVNLTQSLESRDTTELDWPVGMSLGGCLRC